MVKTRLTSMRRSRDRSVFYNRHNNSGHGAARLTVLPAALRRFSELQNHVRHPNSRRLANHRQLNQFDLAWPPEDELSAAIELRRPFPGITDNAKARACVRSIAGWTPLPSPPCSRHCQLNSRPPPIRQFEYARQVYQATKDFRVG
jgi:hypothetical protein